MRKALIVGIDYYEKAPSLHGCVADAHAVSNVLKRNADGTLNFASPKVLLASDEDHVVTRRELKDAVQELFADDSEIALFYFAGHGSIDATGGFLCTSEIADADDGLALAEVMSFANNSKAQNKIIILDSCHSGSAGDSAQDSSMGEVKEGVTIMTASTKDQYSMEAPGGGGGVFTNLLVDALSGGAANLVGSVTPGSVYAHIDQSLGPWEQRPVFKTNVKTFVSLREAEPPIATEHLLSLTTHFPAPNYRFPLDPTYEPFRSQEDLDNPAIPDPDERNTSAFAVLQKLVHVNLVRPVDEEHMFYAAMNSKACELTALGQHYWNLVARERI